MMLTNSIPTYTYSPSVNIIRDQGKQLRYIPTYNGQRAFEQIVETASSGMRAFTIVGAYGTGKSIFLWALAESVLNKKKYFEHYSYLLKGYPTNQLLDIIGDFTSIVGEFANALNCEKKNVLEEIVELADKLNEQRTALIIRIDEFGKFLEYTSKTNPEGEFYFLQKLAEIVNDPQRNIILITTLHQDFAAYAYKLGERQRNEWIKVKGRFKEITFNEPTEQLLLLAAERLDEISFQVEKPLLVELINVLDNAKVFPLNDYFSLEIAGKLTPLDILASSTLAIALQKYGQNERSLFSFIESQDYKGIHQFIGKPDAPLYNLTHVYDYLIYHFYNQLTVKDSEHFRTWRLMRDNIEKAEGLFDDLLIEVTQTIKIIGLLNIFTKASTRIDKEFLVRYCQLVQNHEHTEEVLRLLVQHKIIRFRQHNQRYILFEGTDVDIEYAINAAGEMVGQVSHISQYLNEYFKFPIIPAKKYQIEVGTPRLFEIRLSDEPIMDLPKGEKDGYINLIFSSKLQEVDVQKHSGLFIDQAVLFVFFKNTQRIREQVTEIEKVKQARLKYGDDKTARYEFDHILSHHQNLLRHYVLDKFYGANQNEISFYYSGSKVDEIYNRRSLNAFLSVIAQKSYPATPRYLNEMVNKTKLGTSIVTARKSLLNRLVENVNECNLGFADHLFPPEKTIYFSLLKETGFHKEIDGIWQLTEPDDETFEGILECVNKFLDDAKYAKLSLQELVDRLLDNPIKVKRGFIDFFMPICLLLHQSNFSLFSQGRFIPKINADILDLIVKKPADYTIKTFSAAGVNLSVFNKYRLLLNQKETSKATNNGFIETIRPFLSFYQNLSEFSKVTKKLSKESYHLRNAIRDSTDPEKTFFEDFPKAIGYSLVDLDQDNDKLERYFIELRQGITDIRTSYTSLLNRYEEFILDEIIGDKTLEFIEWKGIFQSRFKDIKSYIVSPHLKVFLQRINSNLDDKNTWLSSLANSILGKHLDEINDQEELLLYERFKIWVHELDNYVDLSAVIQPDKLQDSVKIEITSLKDGMVKQFLTVPKSKVEEVERIEKQLNKHLTLDKMFNIFVLTKMLNEQLK